MAYQQKPMSGALFKNDKGGNEARPDYRGDANINGADYQISAWLKDGANGKFMSLSFQAKDQQRQAAPQRAAPQRPAADDMDDDIPF